MDKREKRFHGVSRRGALASLFSMLIPAVAAEAGAGPVRALAAPDHTCGFGQIECSVPVTGALTEHDCFLPDFLPELELEAYFDTWLFEADEGSTVTIELTSDEFDAVVALVDLGTEEPVAFDDDGGGGTNARIVHTLSGPGPWAILASGFGPDELGDYDLSLSCDELGIPKLRFLDGRFEVTLEWRTPQGQAGVGQPIQITDRSGLFYFFNPDNIEMLIKMLDACSLDPPRFWLFYAATTNVEFRVDVLDTETGATAEYSNPLGRPAPPELDTRAFDTCP